MELMMESPMLVALLCAVISATGTVLAAWIQGRAKRAHGRRRRAFYRKNLRALPTVHSRHHLPENPPEL